jgi:hypothetical protein
MPCMGCALGAPVKGDHLPPSKNAVRCPLCRNWVYRECESDLNVKGCICLDTDDEESD